MSILYLLSLTGVDAVVWDDMKQAYADILDNFFDAAALRPVSDSDHTLSVTVDWNLVSIIDFDETNGYLEVSGYLSFQWTADSLPTGTNDINILAQEIKMWRPPVILVNSLNGFELVGYDSAVQVRVNTITRACEWRPWVVARVACKADVQYYPYDQQECVLHFSVWGYPTSEMTLQIGNTGEWGTEYFEENGEWEISETSAYSSIIQDSSTASFKIKLARQPLYYVINIIAPVVLLGFVNVFTFLLPIDSGERVGFSVTCFLSYVVLLNVVMGLLPSTASPLSYLSYYTFVMMMFSASMSIMTIVTIRIYHKPEHVRVPYCIAVFYLLFTCRKCSRSDRVQKIGISSSSSMEDSLSQYSREDPGVKEVTWKNIAGFIDLFFFIGFLASQMFYSISYLLPVFLNKE